MVVNMQSKTKQKETIRTLTYTALACALIAVCSWISIPIGDIPVTLQTFAVCFCAGLLGWKRGLLAVAVYLVLGAIGVPVFSGFGGGIAKLVGVTGGYLIGFLLTAFLTGWIAERGNRRILPLIFGMVAGLIACYAFGTVWFFLFYVSETGIAGLWSALIKCVFPYLPFDAVKIALAVILVRRLHGLLMKKEPTAAEA